MNRSGVVRKLITLCIFLSILFMAFFIILIKPTNVFAENSGNDNSQVIEINTISEFKQFAIDVNNGIKDGYYGYFITLASNIVLGDEDIFQPIGTPEYPFKGVFCGNGNVIDGINLQSQNDNPIGLFGNIAPSAEIRDLVVKGSIIGKNYTAGLVGYNEGKIINCYNHITIKALSDSVNFGGIVGFNKGEVIGCGNYGEINGDFSSIIGGVIGSNYGKCVNCFNQANIISIDAVIGGVVGQNNQSGLVKECFNNGIVEGKMDIGGIAGINFGKIADVYNKGAIHGSIGNIGGIVGNNEDSAEIKAAFSTSDDIIGHSNIAAIAGLNKGIVYRVYFANDKFNGNLTNGFDASESFGLRTDLMLHSDTLACQDKLGGLLLESENIWFKRASDDIYAYYPELKYFSENNSIESKDSSNTNRKILTNNDIKLTEEKYIYDNTRKEPKIILNDLTLEEGEDYTISYINNIDAGTAEANIILLNNYSGSINKQFFIEKKEIIYEWILEDYIYNATFQAPYAQIVSGIIDEQVVELEYVYETSINFGEYIAKTKLKDTDVSKNYFIQDRPQPYNIKKKDISVVWLQEKLYYNGLPQIPKIDKLNGIINNDILELVYDYSANIDAGNYSLEYGLLDNEYSKNYTLISSKFSYDIHKQPIIIEILNNDIFYNGKCQYPKAKVISGQIGEENVELDYFGYETNINANENNDYKVYIKLLDNYINRNYFLAETECIYNIKKRPITIEWWDTPLVYNGQAQHPTCYVNNGMIGQDLIIFEYLEYSKNINADIDYYVKVKLLDNTINDNYFFEPMLKNYIIEKAKFNINNVVFEDKVFAYDGDDKSIYVASDLPTGVLVEYDNNCATDIGKYIVKARFVVDENNYYPLEEDVLQANLYIANTYFQEVHGSVQLKIIDKISYSMQVEIKKIKDTQDYKLLKKKILGVYSITIVDFDGKVQITVPLSDKIMKAQGIGIAFLNANGAIIYPEYIIDNNQLTFYAENIVSFAIVSDKKNSVLYITIGSIVGLLIVCIVVLAIVYIKKKICNENQNENKIKEKIQDNSFDCKNNDAEVKNSNEQLKMCKNEINNRELLEVKNNTMKNSDTDCAFVLDGILCNSFELFMCSLNFRNIDKQKRVCAGDLYAIQLKEAIPRNKIFWQGKKYVVGSQAYLELIERARRLIDEKNS